MMKRYIIVFGVSIILNSALANNYTAISNRTSTIINNINQRKSMSVLKSKSFSNINDSYLENIIEKFNLDHTQKEVLMSKYKDYVDKFSKDPSKIDQTMNDIKSGLINQGFSDLLTPKVVQPDNIVTTNYMKLIGKDRYEHLKNWKYVNDINAVLNKIDDNWYVIKGKIITPYLSKSPEIQVAFKNTNYSKGIVLDQVVSDYNEMNPLLYDIKTMYHKLRIITENGTNVFKVFKEYKLNPQGVSPGISIGEKLQQIGMWQRLEFWPTQMFKWIPSSKPPQSEIFYLNSSIDDMGGFDNFLELFKEIRDRADAEAKIIKIISNFKSAKATINGVIIGVAAIAAISWFAAVFTKGITATIAAAATTVAGVLNAIKEILSAAIDEYEQLKDNWMKAGKTLVATLTLGNSIRQLIYNKMMNKLAELSPLKWLLGSIVPLYYLISNTLELLSYYK